MSFFGVTFTLLNRKNDTLMHKFNDEILKNTMMGMAVLALLDDEEVIISPEKIVAMLHHIAATEDNPSRQRACERAIAELRRSHSQRDHAVVHRGAPGLIDESHNLDADGKTH